MMRRRPVARRVARPAVRAAVRPVVRAAGPVVGPRRVIRGRGGWCAGIFAVLFILALVTVLCVFFVLPRLGLLQNLRF
ncbi:MAG: hypothetical protein FJZ96_12320 [Chloroflexi bacterium]|nr:hypothetical protein [Chloroflexota bacterium]